MNAPLVHPAQPPTLLAWRDHPLAQRGYTHFAPYELTIEQMVAQIAHHLPSGFLRHGEVRINGQPIKRHAWARRAPRPVRPGDVVLTLHLPLQGGGGSGGGKNVLLTVASIAVLLAAAAVSGGVFGAFGSFAIGSATFTGAQAIGAGIAIAGSLAIRALTPPPSLEALAQAKPRTDASSQNRTASLNGNLLQPGAPLPRVLGTKKIFPPFACQPLIDIVGDDEVIEGVYLLAGKHKFDDFRLKGIPVSNVEDTEIEYREGWDGDTAMTLVTRYGVTEQVGIQLSESEADDAQPSQYADQANPENSFTTPHPLRTLSEPDEFWLTLAAPSGFANLSSLAAPIAVPVRLRARRRGSVSWINFPEVHFTHFKSEPFQRLLRIHWTTAPAMPTPKTTKAPYVAFNRVPMRVEHLVESGFSNTSRLRDGNNTANATQSAAAVVYAGARFYNDAVTYFEFPKVVNRFEVWPDVGGNGFGNQNDITFELVYAADYTAIADPLTEGTVLASTAITDGATTTTPVIFQFPDTLCEMVWVRASRTSGGAMNWQWSEIRPYGAEPYSWKAHDHFISSVTSFFAYLDATNVGTTTLQNVALNYESADFYLDPATFTPGVYDIEVRRGNPYLNSDFTPSTYVLNIGSAATGGLVGDLFGYALNSASPPKYLLGRNNANHSAKIGVSRAASVWNEAPVQMTGHAQIQIKTRRDVDRLSVVASSYVPRWNGLDAFDDWGTSSNPADHFYDALAGELAAKPLAAARIHQDSIVEMWQESIARNYRINAIVEGQDGEDALNLCAGVAYGRLWQSERYGVVLDRDTRNEIPRQVFTPRNMRGFKWTKAFADLPVGFRLRIDDIENDYGESERIILRPGATDTGIYESLRYDALVDWADATQRAQYDLLYPRHRAAIYSGESPLRHIVSARGDLVGVAYDVLARPSGSARVKTITTSGGNVTGLTLDGTVLLDPALGARFGAALWLNDQETRIVVEVELPGAAEEVTTLTLVTPFPDPGSSILSADCMVTTGVLGSEFKRMKVADVIPKDEFTATVSFVDEAPQLFNRAA